MFWLAMAVSVVVGVAYLAICSTIVRKVLVFGDQWRTNPLATATAAIFLSCGIGHLLHGVHLLEMGRGAVGLYEPHITLWDLGTAAVAIWYWSLRGRLTALRGMGELFQDTRVRQQQRLSEHLGQLFDGVVVLDLAAEPDVRAQLVGSRPVTALLARIPREHAPTTADALAALASAAGGRPQRRELMLGDPASERPLVLEAQAIAWDGQETVVTWRDVTEEVSRREAQRVAQAELAATFDAAPIAMAVVSSTGIDRSNPALQDLVGGRPPGGAWLELFGAQHQAEAKVRLEASLQGRTVKAWDAQLDLGQGARRWTNVSLAPIRDGAGAVEAVVAHLVDVEDRKRYEGRLRHLAEHDPLTGLANRRRFEYELQRQCDLNTRYGSAGALLMLDLDHFKDVNDTLGHAVGDELIVSVAHLLRAELRGSDVVARLGGDEFAMLAQNANAVEGAALAARLCETIRKHSRALSQPAAVRRVTASIGLVQFGDVAATPDAMLMAGDLTLYDAKAAGRDGWAAYSNSEHSQPRTKSRLEWLERLREALDTDALVVLAQPLLDLRNGDLTHAELLLRLRDQTGALVAPSRFLYMAQQSDLICDVDRWMLRYALKALAARPEMRLCVNISGRSISDRTVTADMVEAIEHAGLAPGRLTVEITETEAVASLHQARDGLLAVQGASCLVALDDFGAGYGSLAYVKHLPFDVIKIDGQFVEGSCDNEVDRTVIDAVVSLARGLGKEVVAEHVSSPGIEGLVREHGVDYAQGFHIGLPEPLDLMRIPQARAMP
jgi:diguanylate cyclase (GGDEF)-like protein/PAS domain S-box-containing protein